MTFYNKLKYILGILIVFVLIVTTNLIDRSNFLRVKESVETLYEDRLIANDLLFDLSKAIHEKEVAILEKDSLFLLHHNAALNSDIQAYAQQYESTRLTEEEHRLFEQLKSNLSQLHIMEKEWSITPFSNTRVLLDHCANIKGNLHNLSKIQLLEGRRQVSISRKAIDTVELFTQMEIYLLAFLAIVVQIIILYKPKES